MTDRDRELLIALVLKVRAFSQRQIAEHWWDGEVANARRRLKQLATGNLIHRVAVPVRTLPLIELPVISWRPDQPAPDFAAISYRLQSRWQGRPVRPVTAFIATERSAQLFGGKARGDLKHPTQATHDLGVAAIWLRFHEQSPAWADAWQSEDLLAHTRRGEKLPDAFILNAEGQTVSCIEFGGAYDARRVEEFHADCASRDLPYQIW